MSAALPGEGRTAVPTGRCAGCGTRKKLYGNSCVDCVRTGGRHGNAPGRGVKVYSVSGHRVDVRLHSTRDPEGVFWSDRSNSYVVATTPRGEYTLKGKPVALYSVNGIGEIRWDVPRWALDHALKMEKDGKLTPDSDAYEQLQAARYYGLTPAAAHGNMPTRSKSKTTHHLTFAGYNFTSGPGGTVIHRPRIDLNAPGDYGADPLGDGRFRMVPSGDIVDSAERDRRLSQRSGSRSRSGNAAESRRLPHGWQDWARFTKHPVSAHDNVRFIEWAEPAPLDPSASRYAVVQYHNHIAWARVSPNPDVSTDYSGGGFYDDMPGGAIEAAKRAAMLHKAKMKGIMSDFDAHVARRSRRGH